jgi:hypothetical protein
VGRFSGRGGLTAWGRSNRSGSSSEGFDFTGFSSVSLFVLIRGAFR